VENIEERVLEGRGSEWKEVIGFQPEKSKRGTDHHSRFLCSCHRCLRHSTSLSFYSFLAITSSPSRLNGRKRLWVCGHCCSSPWAHLWCQILECQGHSSSC
jgi:hypothetical protein